MTENRNMENYKVNKPYLKVACILDNFSYSCLKYECNLIQLNINTWKDTIIREKPHLLLVESAWRGVEDSWRRKIGNINSIKDSNLKNLIKICNSLNIPTVFWNKEDPYHFKHFIDTARLFKYVFTTDQGCIPVYKRLLKHNRVFLLPFAAQPKLHNPINKDKDKIGDIAFAGTWYTMKHPTRRKNLDFLLTPALKYNLHIYDRTYNYTYPEKRNYTFPMKFQPYIKGYLPYEDMIKFYKKYKIFLNVNSLNNSSSMFSRRIVELLACGTTIISSYALSLENFFPSIIKLSKNKEETNSHIELLLKDEILRDKLSLIGEREVFNKHTYTHRLESIIDKIGLKYDKCDMPSVSIITIASSPTCMNNVFQNYVRQNHIKKELIIILSNNDLNIDEWIRESTKYPNIRIIKANKNKSTSYYYNLAIPNCKGKYLSFFDEHSYYAEDFLVDLVNATEYTEGEIIGKLSCYKYSEDEKKLHLQSPNFENQYVNLLSPHALIIKKQVFDDINFKSTLREGLWEDFFKECSSKNFKVYSIDRFNFIDLKRNKLQCKPSFFRRNTSNNFEYIQPGKAYIDFVTV